MRDTGHSHSSKEPGLRRYHRPLPHSQTWATGSLGLLLGGFLQGLAWAAPPSILTTPCNSRHPEVLATPCLLPEGKQGLQRRAVLCTCPLGLGSGDHRRIFDLQMAQINKQESQYRGPPELQLTSKLVGSEGQAPRHLTPGDRTNWATQEGVCTWERWREGCHVPWGRPKFDHATKSKETVGH